jgi:hypothetical protein
MPSCPAGRRSRPAGIRDPPFCNSRAAASVEKSATAASLCSTGAFSSRRAIMTASVSTWPNSSVALSTPCPTGGRARMLEP